MYTLKNTSETQKQKGQPRDDIQNILTHYKYAPLRNKVMTEGRSIQEVLFKTHLVPTFTSHEHSHCYNAYMPK